MKFEYGSEGKYLDVTEVVFSKFKMGNKIVFPSGEKKFDEYFGNTEKCRKNLLIKSEKCVFSIEECDIESHSFDLDPITVTKISVVLNVYKRLNHLEEQIKSILDQTIKPTEIFIWNNSGVDLGPMSKYEVPIVVFSSSKNMGVWSRFFAAYNCNGEYVAMFDDDTIPGKKWFENCINSMMIKEGLYGTTGYRFRKKYANALRIGWMHGNERIEEMDIVGHAWFFKKDWLKYYGNDLPDFTKFKTCGEDIHFSYTLLKYANIKTYVPPHPLDDRELHGSLKGKEYGLEDVGICRQKGSDARFEDVYDHWVKELGHRTHIQRYGCI